MHEPDTITAITPRTIDTRVVDLRRLSETSYELVVERNDLSFRSGQLINLHGRTHLEDRSYTICSGEKDEHLTVIFRLVPKGILTPQLAALRPGDTIKVSGPYGEFVVRDPARPLIFFATGTGIAPCHSYVRSHNNLKMTLVHGVRHACDLYYREMFSAWDYQPCLTADPHQPDVFHGRVTEYARTRNFEENSHYYLCGANEMIYEMQEILTGRGVPHEHIFTEAYYYRSDDA